MESSRDGVGSHADASQSKDKNRKSKRAPQELYVPRGRRHNLPAAESTPDRANAAEGDDPGNGTSELSVKQPARKNEKKKGREGGKGKQQRHRRVSTDEEEGGGVEAKEKKVQNKGKHGKRGDQQRYVPKPQRDTIKEGRMLPDGQNHDHDPKQSGNADKLFVESTSGSTDDQLTRMGGQSVDTATNAPLVPEDWNEIDCDDRDLTCRPTGTRLNDHGKLIPVDPADVARLEAVEMEARLKESQARVDLESKQNESSEKRNDRTNVESIHDNSMASDSLIQVDDENATDGSNLEMQTSNSLPNSREAMSKPETSAWNTSDCQKDGIEIVDISADASVSRTNNDSTFTVQNKYVKEASKDCPHEDSQETMGTDKALTQEISADQLASISTSAGAVGELNSHQGLSSIVHDSGVDTEALFKDALLMTDDMEVCDKTNVTPVTDNSDCPTSSQLAEVAREKCEGESVVVESVHEVSELFGKSDDCRHKNEDTEDDDWETMFDESGDCLKQDELLELSECVGNVQVSVKHSKKDYYNYQPKDNTDYSELEHVIEVYDFPADFKTQDLIVGFSNMKTKEMNIKWIDDTHALAVFPSSVIAQDALGLSNPMFRTRPLMLASREAKMKARDCEEFLLPSKPRPETSAATARRLVSGALGLKSNVSKEQRAAEKNKIKEAKDRRRSDKKMQENIWDGNV